MSPIKLIFASALLACCLTKGAHAWGYEGHRIAAEITEQFLEPEIARQVRQLLALDNTTTLGEVSTWADEIQPQRPETARWHFVNIPIHPPAGTSEGYNPARDCPKGDCVVAKIDEFTATLRDKSARPRERLEALKFLVHFVADAIGRWPPPPKPKGMRWRTYERKVAEWRNADEEADAAWAAEAMRRFGL